jgi:ATP adenylyltransferase
LSDVSQNEVRNQFDGCRLCWAISEEGQRHPANTIVHSTDEHVVVPALGSIIEGYVMLVSKRHRSSVATLTPQRASEVQREIDSVLSMLEQQSSSTRWVVFEHGTTLDCGLKACCVDHLHLHLLPVDMDLAADLATRLSCEARRIDALQDLRQVRESGADNYIYVRNPDGTHYVLTPPAYSSQFVRQVLAERAGKGEFWNWQNHPMENDSVKTIRMFRDAGITPRAIYYAHAIEDLSTAEVKKNIQEARASLSRHCPQATLFSMYELLEKSLHEIDLPENRLNDYLVETERKFIEASDLLIVDLSRPNWQYVGSLMEIVYAAEAGVSVIAVVGNSSIQGRRWLKAHVTCFVKTVEEAFEVASGLLQKQAEPK